MHPLVNILLITLHLIWITFAVLGVLQNRRHARRFLRPPRPESLEFQPPAVIIMPIKGIDRDLPGCIAGLCNQAYPDYRVIIVVESKSDPAYPILLEELAKHPHRPSRIMIAGQAAANEGQKVHNQLHVLREILPTLAESDVIAFADSDAIPGETWLSLMVARLSTGKNGVTTGYRWMIPDPARPATIWSHVASVINGSVAAVHRPSDADQAWGGAMAMLVSTARKGDLITRLTGALTDDYPITKMCRDIGMIVRYVPKCLAATPVDFSLRSFWTFARRQYVITRIYSPRLFWFALLVLTFWLAGFISAWAQLITGLATPDPMGHVKLWLPAAIVISVVVICQHLRSHYRTQTIRNAFGQPMVEQLRTTLRIDRWLPPLWMTIHWLIALSSLSSNRFTWRGYRYQLDGPNQVKRLTP